jgi:ATP-dependent DNA helicase RecG
MFYIICAANTQKEQKNVIVIDVPRATRTDKPIFINNDVYHGSYRRHGDYHCSENEVRNMIRDSSTRALLT